MKLNYECMRKTLMVLEDKLLLADDLSFNQVGINEISEYPELSDFGKSDIAYCVYMLNDAGLILTCSGNELIRELRVETITYKGHEFLEKIRNETIWNKTKEKLKPLGAMTIEIISQVASNVITQMLVSQGLL